MKTEPRVWEVMGDTPELDSERRHGTEELSNLADHMKLDEFYDALELEFEAIIEEDERKDWVHVRDVIQWADEHEPMVDDELVRYYVQNAWRDELTAAQTVWLMALRALGPGFVALGMLSAIRSQGEFAIMATLFGIVMTALAYFGPRTFFDFVTDEGRRVPRTSPRTQMWGFLLITTACALLGFGIVGLG
ncbi:MAG: hypothetical protein H6834_08290 [Planctomycetes bacterium]|nr:hypothetical protein [Planctomycetota bacterium]